MKYIITWVTFMTFNANHGPNLVLQLRTIEEPHKLEYTSRLQALQALEEKKKEVEGQYEYIGTTKVLPCPKCYDYIGKLKIDSVKTDIK